MRTRRIALAGALTALMLALGGAATASVLGGKADSKMIGSVIKTDQGIEWCYSYDEWKKQRNPTLADFAPTIADQPAAAGLGSMARGGHVDPSRWTPDGWAAAGVSTDIGDVGYADRWGGGRGWGLDPGDVKGDTVGVWRGSWAFPETCKGEFGWNRWDSRYPVSSERVAEFWIVEGHAPEYVNLNLTGWSLLIRAKASAPDHFTDQFRYRWRTSAGWSNVATVTLER